ncbi:hypothetical protein NM688_g5065 [Phlebia brevispora]|uniref:Uncharacterized protein n=1 Tax=Phlebia brevispora TaxID=194682 RepID=A0ACC1T189_9APHY|nr:hypothetical protein NM688_g5065 [Phlebia brevispora]
MPSLTEFMAPTAGVAIPLALMCSGVLSVQVYFYLLEYQEDPYVLKGFVIFIWLVECIQSAFCVHIMHTYIGDDFSDIVRILETTWSVGVTIALAVVLIVLIQSLSASPSFYIYRAWSLSKRNWLVAAIPGVTLLCRAGSGLTTASLTYKYPNFLSFTDARATKYAVNLALGLGVAVDLMVASFLIYELTQSTRNGVRTTGLYVQAILKYAIGTGACTLFLSIASLAVYNLLPMNLMFTGLVEILCKLYANMMMVNLNARKRIRNTAVSSPQVFDSIAVSSSASGNTGGRNAQKHHSRSVQVLKEVEVRADQEDLKAVVV